MQKNLKSTDIVIVGAGYTGLSCALTLQNKDVNFVLLEASDHVGGRAIDKMIEGHFRLELEGQYICPLQTRITKLVETLGLRTYEAYGKGNNFLAHEEKIAFYQSSPASCLGNLLHDKTIQSEVEASLALLDGLHQEISPYSPWEHKDSATLDGMTFQTWIDAHLMSLPAKQFFRFMTNQGFSTEPEQVSLLQMLWFFKTSHGLPAWALGKGQANRVEGGTGLVAIKMAEKIKEHLHYNEPVIKIEQKEGFTLVHTENGIYKAKSAVICVPPQLILSLQYSPPLPP